MKIKFKFLKRFIKHYSWAHLIALAVLGAFVLLRVTDSQPVQLLRFKVFDGFQQINPREDSKQPVVIIDLDDERKAAMISSLLVVLCSDEAAQPVVNTGTLYS